MARYYMEVNRTHDQVLALDPEQRKYVQVLVSRPIHESSFFPLAPQEKVTGTTGMRHPWHRSHQNEYRSSTVLKIGIHNYETEDFIFDNWPVLVRQRISQHMNTGLLIVRLDSTSTTSPNRIINIASAGSGYVVGDILTLSGGTFTTAATLEVLEIDGSGGVTFARIDTFGSYSSRPSNPVSTTGGSGTGATFNLTFDIEPLAPADIV